MVFNIKKREVIKENIMVFVALLDVRNHQVTRWLKFALLSMKTDCHHKISILVNMGKWLPIHNTTYRSDFSCGMLSKSLLPVGLRWEIGENVQRPFYKSWIHITFCIELTHFLNIIIILILSKYKL